MKKFQIKANSKHLRKNFSIQRKNLIFSEMNSVESNFKNNEKKNLRKGEKIVFNDSKKICYNPSKTYLKKRQSHFSQKIENISAAIPYFGNSIRGRVNELSEKQKINKKKIFNNLNHIDSLLNSKKSKLSIIKSEKTYNLPTFVKDKNDEKSNKKFFANFTLNSNINEKFVRFSKRSSMFIVKKKKKSFSSNRNSIIKNRNGLKNLWNFSVVQKNFYNNKNDKTIDYYIKKSKLILEESKILKKKELNSNEILDWNKKKTKKKINKESFKKIKKLTKIPINNLKKNETFNIDQSSKILNSCTEENLKSKIIDLKRELKNITNINKFNKVFEKKLKKKNNKKKLKKKNLKDKIKKNSKKKRILTKNIKNHKELKNKIKIDYLDYNKFKNKKEKYNSKNLPKIKIKNQSSFEDKIKSKINLNNTKNFNDLNDDKKDYFYNILTAKSTFSDTKTFSEIDSFGDLF